MNKVYEQITLILTQLVLEDINPDDPRLNGKPKPTPKPTKPTPKPTKPTPHPGNFDEYGNVIPEPKKPKNPGNGNQNGNNT